MLAYYLYKIARFFAQRVPLKLAYAIASFLSVMKFYLSPRDRRAVIGNLKKILPEADDIKLEAMGKEVFANFGKYLIEFFRFSSLNKNNLKELIAVKNLNYIDEALKDGKGAIVLSAHLGNWELGGVAMSILDYPLYAVALPHSHHKVDALFNEQREKVGVVVVPSLGAALRNIFSALKNNKLVALVGDRDFANGGLMVDFLGAKKIIPRGPAVVSIRTGAPIIPGFVTFDETGKYTLEFQEHIKPDCSEEELIKKCAEVIEKKIRSNPTQWLMFREFWKE